MRFAQTEILWLAAALLPALTVFFVWAWRKKQKLIGQFVQSRLLANLTVGVSHARQKLRLVLLFFAVAFALLALARPQWGFDWEEAHQQGIDIVVAIDTSKSMLASDVSPNRLMRAKLAAFDLMKLAKSDRLGLIAFAGSAFLQCPLTLDEEAFRQSVEALDVSIIPQGGTALAEAIDTAVNAFEKSGDNHKVLVLFTDGEDQESGVTEAVDKAEKAGLKIFTIGVGTPEGELLRVPDEQGRLTFLKDDQGNAVKSRLNENLLREIATKAHGFYLPLLGANPMESVYNKGLAPLPKSDSTTKLVRNYREQFKWPLGLSILLLVLEMFLPQRKRVRKTEAMVAAGNVELKKAVTTLALLLPLLSFGSTSSAERKYHAGKFDEAMADYQQLLEKKTNDFRLFFNAGDAAYKAKLFDSAKKNFDVALQSPDLNLQEQAYYNLGNTLYQIGEAGEDPQEKQVAWESAIKNYENALKLNPQDQDAKNNLAFVKKKLEELKKQQQEQKQQNKNDQSRQDNKDDKQNADKNQQDQQNKQDSAKDDKQEKNQKQDQQKQNSEKQDQQQQEQAQNNQQDQQKKEQQQQAQNHDKKGDQQKQAQGQKPDGKKEGQEGQMAQAVAGQMTPQQAMQFLEAQKQQDRTLIFVPQQPQKPRNPNHPLKDW